MAVILSAPAQNSVLCDANITEIIIEDSSVFEHYTASVHINNKHYDHIVMPRIPKILTNRLVLEFDNLLLKYIDLPEPSAFPYLGTSAVPIIQPFPVLNDLRVELWRTTSPGGTTVTTKIFEFNYKLFYAQNPTAEKYTDYKLTFAGVDPDCLLVSPSTIFRIPFYARNPESAIVFRAVKEDDTVIYSHTFVNTGDYIYVANVPVAVPNDVDSYIIQIQYNHDVIYKKVRVMRDRLYQSKSIIFYNRFGMPVQIELFGKKSIKNDFDFHKYQTGMGIFKTAEVGETGNFIIDTGYMLDSERAIVHQILSSLDVRIEHNGVFVPCVVKTKSAVRFSENDFVTNTQLQFEFNQNPKIKN